MRKFHAKRGMKNTVQGAVYVREGSERNDWINFNSWYSFLSEPSPNLYIISKNNHKTPTIFFKNFLERPTGWGCFVYHFSV